MATRTRSTVSTIDVSPLYHDFEPYCEWKRGDDLLIVHVPEFKKEHLRVQVNTSGVLKISGERPLDGEKLTTRSRFYKETRVPEGCNINDVYAKLSDGKLTITLPRKSPSILLPSSSSSPEFSVPKKLSTSTIDQTETRSSLLDEVKDKCQLDEKEDDMVGFGGLKIAKKIVVNVGIAVVAIATIGALVFFKPETPSASPSSAAFAKREE